MGFFWLAFLPIVLILIRQITERREFPVNNKGIILITGASTGIGRHAAEHIAKNHKDVLVLAGVRKESDGEDITKQDIANLKPLIIDVAKHESCVEAVGRIKEIMDSTKLPFIGLVNNAGIGRNLPFEYHDLNDVKATFDVNVFGVYDLSQQMLPLLIESKGRLVALSSIAGLVGSPLRSAYSGSKFALEGIYDSVRREVADLGVSVSLIEPGMVKSAIFDKAKAQMRSIGDDKSKEMKERYSHIINEASTQRKIAQIEGASDPIVTSEAIEHAIFSNQPKTRYVVANIGALPGYVSAWTFWLLPDRLEDWLVSKLH